MYTFSQHKQLPLLGTFLPIIHPVLPSTAYDMTLCAYVFSPEDHPKLLELLEAWPVDIYDVGQVLATVLNRLKGTNATLALKK